MSHSLPRRIRGCADGGALLARAGAECCPSSVAAPACPAGTRPMERPRLRFYLPMRLVSVLVSTGLAGASLGAITVHATSNRSGCHLAARYDGSTSGTGNVYAVFVLHNDGDRTCGPDTYPKLRLLG